MLFLSMAAAIQIPTIKNEVKGISLKNVVNLPKNRKDGKTCCNSVYDLTPKENQSLLVYQNFSSMCWSNTVVWRAPHAFIFSNIKAGKHLNTLWCLIGPELQGKYLANSYVSLFVRHLLLNKTQLAVISILLWQVIPFHDRI